MYDTYEVCRKKGNEAFLNVADNINPDIFAYDCEEITDECGNKYYGIYFYVYNHEKSIEEKFYY